MRIKIKPLSVNEAWQGRRFKTKKYIAFERELLLKLKPVKIPDGELSISIVYGFSSKLSDIDNPTKMVLDVLQKKYKFNDSRIFELSLKKEIVEKGNEFINIEIKEIN